jgi:hypothetical protein|tara:strand:- start:754 stop:1074 length:321 start_codon:yes stop_codon:yes gene_type:complete
VEDDIVLTVGTIYDLEYIKKSIKTRDEPKMPLFHGISVIEPSINGGQTPGTVMFKFQPSSWHYGWRSSKHTKSLTHAFWVYIFTPISGSNGTKYRLVLRCCKCNID